MNLSNAPSFIDAVARDGRSYKPVNYDNAARIAEERNIKSPEEIAAWRKLKVRFVEAKAREDEEEEDLGEAPEEFMDPLLWALMEDPVILPISRVTVDRSTIQSHLLSDPNDPFNRTPLKIEDVIDDTEKKAAIVAWKTEMKAKAKAARAAAAPSATNSNAMDVTEG